MPLTEKQIIEFANNLGDADDIIAQLYANHGLEPDCTENIASILLTASAMFFWAARRQGADITSISNAMSDGAIAVMEMLEHSAPPPGTFTQALAMVHDQQRAKDKAASI